MPELYWSMNCFDLAAQLRENALESEEVAER